jgi:hypothetical protein
MKKEQNIIEFLCRIGGLRRTNEGVWGRTRKRKESEK